MKIGEVEIGVEYAALDSPKSRGRYGGGIRPRRVKAVEIVTREEKRYTSTWTPSKKVNVKRVKVEFLDEEAETGRWSYNEIASAKQGAKRVIEARQLVTTWDVVAPEVEAKQAREALREQTREALEARLSALVPEETKRGYWTTDVNVYEGGDVRRRATFSDEALDNILALAEAGAAKRKKATNTAKR